MPEAGQEIDIVEENEEITLERSIRSRKGERKRKYDMSEKLALIDLMRKRGLQPTEAARLKDVTAQRLRDWIKNEAKLSDEADKKGARLPGAGRNLIADGAIDERVMAMI